MDLICLACPHCLNDMNRDPGDLCPTHRQHELATTPTGQCDHHRTPRPDTHRTRAQRRAQRRTP